MGASGAGKMFGRDREGNTSCTRCRLPTSPELFAETRTYLKIKNRTETFIIRRMLRLSDPHWERIRDHFPEENIPAGRAGRKPISSRRILAAVLWILNTGAQWHMLPQCYPNYKTVHRRFQSGGRGGGRRGGGAGRAGAGRGGGALD